MKNHILNINSQLLAYNDSQGVSDNPRQRSFDWTRRIASIPISRPLSDSKTLAPGASAVLFNGTKPTGLTVSSIMSLSILSSVDSLYRLSISSGPSSFRTPRSPTNITNCNVQLNNNALAVFDFVGITTNDIAIGDIMRIKGEALFDVGPFAFNPLNAGIWYIVGISGTKISCIRGTDSPFQGANESVTGVSSDLTFYSADGIQKGDRMVISGVFSSVSQRTYQITDVQPSKIDIISTAPIPEESALNYVTNSIIIYSNAKRMIYIEANQDCVVQFNNDTSDNNRVTPIQAGTLDLVGYLNKWGDMYSCTVVNKSILPLDIKYITAE